MSHRFFYLAYGFNHIGGMTVCTVHDQHIHALINKAFCPLVVVDSHRSTYPQSPLAVFASIGEAFHHVDVLNGYKARQSVIFVNQ